MVLNISLNKSKFKIIIFIIFVGQGWQKTVTAPQRTHDSARVLGDGASASTGAARGDAAGPVAEPVGSGRVDRSVERALLGVGRPGAPGQGAALG